MNWLLRDRSITFPRRPLIAGIVNVNDDSFSGDGTLVIDDAIVIARAHVEAGADVIDVGAESARTNRAAVSVDEEVRRFRGFLDRWSEVIDSATPKDTDQLWPPVLSLNTWRPEVVAQVIGDRQVELINDMGGLPDD
ncbi:MAG: dihydropteroate synthase, partial [Verrucomicrobiales bacterium]